MVTASKGNGTVAMQAISIEPIRTETIVVLIRGTRPIILNRLSEKARRELLMPSGRKSTAVRAASLKHVPIDEFRASPYTLAQRDAPTLLAVPASSFKGAMMTAALRVPGARKTEIGQLLWVEGDLLPLYGVPKLMMSPVRSADMNRTPDIRTRAIVPEWAVSIAITFTTPLLNDTSVVNLLSAAGQICGVGDWRPEKGKGTFGQFTLINDDDEPLYRLITEGGGRDAQLTAMANPEAYDAESEELRSWYEKEVLRLGKGSSAKKEA